MSCKIRASWIRAFTYFKPRGYDNGLVTGCIGKGSGTFDFEFIQLTRILASELFWNVANTMISVSEPLMVVTAVIGLVVVMPSIYGCGLVMCVVVWITVQYGALVRQLIIYMPEGIPRLTLATDYVRAALSNFKMICVSFDRT